MPTTPVVPRTAEQSRAVAHEHTSTSGNGQLVTDLIQAMRAPMADLRAAARALADGASGVPGVYVRQVHEATMTLSAMVDDLFTVTRSHVGQDTTR